MSKPNLKQRVARLQRQNLESSYSWEELDNDHSRMITFTERELGFPIMGDYPLMKFLQEYVECIKLKQEDLEIQAKMAGMGR